MEDLQNASKLLVKALHVRESYMTASQQSFSNAARRFLIKRSNSVSKDYRVHKNKATLQGKEKNHCEDPVGNLVFYTKARR